jgi:hypothetical protein
MRITSPTRSILNSLFSALALLCGCELPPIPLDPMEPDQRGEQDMFVPPEFGLLCEPGERGCLGLTRAFVCDAMGNSLSTVECGEGQRCLEGSCLRLENTCEKDELLRLTPRELLFETAKDLKSQTAVVNLSNCSAQDVQLQVANVIESPRHADGTPVFSFDTIAPQGFKLPPGESFNLKLLYRPREQFYQDEAKLRLVAQGDSVNSEQLLLLRTRSLCLSGSPQVELGVFAAGKTQARWPLVNCGSEPLRLRSLSWLNVFGGDGLEEGSAALVDAQGGSLLGAVLEPGERLDAWLAVEQGKIGPVNFTPTLTAEPVRESSQPLVQRLQTAAWAHGFARAPLAQGCRAEAQPVMLVNSQPSEVGERWQVEPWTPVLVAPATPAHWTHYEAVDGALPLERGQLNDTLGLLASRVTTHLLRATQFDEAGVPGCAPGELELVVWPTDPLYVELAWSTEGDPIPDDEGEALGVDLDLYVHFERGAGAQQVPWTRTSSVCAPPPSTPAVDAPFNVPCASGRGVIKATSRSGAGVEAMSVDAPARVDIGVWLQARHGWKGALATLRVWRDGVLDDELNTLNPIPMTAVPSFYYAGLCKPNDAQCVALGNTLGSLE